MGLFSSRSSSSSSTTNVDARVVGGEGSINTSITGDNNTVTDHGAVQGSLQLALAGVEGAQRLASQAQEASGGILQGALRMAGEQQQQFASTLENVKTADVRVLVIVGLSVVALVGAMFLRKG